MHAFSEVFQLIKLEEIQISSKNVKFENFLTQPHTLDSTPNVWQTWQVELAKQFKWIIPTWRHKRVKQARRPKQVEQAWRVRQPRRVRWAKRVRRAQWPKRVRRTRWPIQVGWANDLNGRGDLMTHMSRADLTTQTGRWSPTTHTVQVCPTTKMCLAGPTA